MFSDKGAWQCVVGDGRRSVTARCVLFAMARRGADVFVVEDDEDACGEPLSSDSDSDLGPEPPDDFEVPARPRRRAPPARAYWEALMHDTEHDARLEFDVASAGLQLPRLPRAGGSQLALELHFMGARVLAARVPSHLYTCLEAERTYGSTVRIDTDGCDAVDVHITSRRREALVDEEPAVTRVELAVPVRTLAFLAWRRQRPQ